MFFTVTRRYDSGAAALQHVPGVQRFSSGTPVTDALGYCGTGLDAHAPSGRDAALGCIPENGPLQAGSTLPTGQYAIWLACVTCVEPLHTCTSCEFHAGQGQMHAAASSRYRLAAASTDGPGVRAPRSLASWGVKCIVIDAHILRRMQRFDPYASAQDVM